jgi:hypothetical protein
MKKYLHSLIVTTVVAAPAFAHVLAYRAAPGSDWRTSPNSVYSDGEYRGTDPDPQIRFELRRESPHGGA